MFNVIFDHKFMWFTLIFYGIIEKYKHKRALWSQYFNLLLKKSHFLTKEVSLFYQRSFAIRPDSGLIEVFEFGKYFDVGLF